MTRMLLRPLRLLPCLALLLVACEEGLDSVQAPTPETPDMAPAPTSEWDPRVLRGVPQVPELETSLWTGEEWVPRADVGDGWPQNATPMSGLTGQCPEGQVSLSRFRAPEDGFDEYTQVQTRGAVEAPELPPRGIEVLAVLCGTNRAPQDLEGMRTACSGREVCNYRPQCGTVFGYSYRCAAGTMDTDPSDIRTVTGMNPRDSSNPLRLSCTPTGEDVEPVAQTTCVPKVCRGRTRRNADFQCVPDLTMPFLYASTTNAPISERIFTLENPLTSAVDDFHGRIVSYWNQQNTQSTANFYASGEMRGWEYYFGNGPYRMIFRAPHNLPLPASAGARSNVPALPQLEGVRAVLWFSDVWHFSDGTSVETFRCVGRTFETELNAQGQPFWAAQDVPFNEDCFSHESHRASFAEAIARKGWSLALPVPTRGDGMMHMSFDMEGRTLFVPEPFDEGAACAPNPPEFFYDPETKRYDLLAYYRQRLWTTFMNPTAPQRPRMMRLTSAPRVTFGIDEVNLRDTEVTIYQAERFPATVTIDLTWYSLFESRDNPLSTASWLTEAGVQPGNDATSLRVNYYLYEAESLPTDPEELFRLHGPLLGSARLTSATPEGTTVSTRLSIPQSTKDRLFDPTRRFFTPPSVQQRQYWVKACLASDNPANPMTSFFHPTQDINQSAIFFRRHILPGTFLYGMTSLGLPRTDEGFFNPFPTPPARHAALVAADNAMAQYRLRGVAPFGCAWAPLPITLIADPYHRHVDPVLDTGWSGLAQADESGDETANGNLDGDMGRICEQLPDRPRVCRSDMTQGGAGGGNEFRQSYHHLSIGVTVEEDNVARAEGMGELFGFQLFDSLGIEIDPDAAWPPGEAPSFPVTVDPDFDFEEGFVELRIYPPFGEVATALNQGRNPASRISWVGDDRDGLALTYTYKKPVKIGPIPGEASFTFSVGVRFNTLLRFRWKPPTTYPCEGQSAPCYVLSAPTNTRGHADAQAQCRAMGGRLAELSTQEEADAVLDAFRTTSGLSTLWLGGQIAYRYEDPVCRTPLLSQCAGRIHSVARWLYGDLLLREESGSIVPGRLYGASRSNLNGVSPTPFGLLMSADRSVGGVQATQRHRYLCRYEPVLQAEYMELKFAKTLGVFAGFGLGFCSPSSKGGVCVKGSVRFADVETIPSFTLSDWTFYEPGPVPGTRREVMRETNATVAVDFGVTLMSVGISATIKLWVFSRTWDLLKFPGFRVADMRLFEFSVPSSVRL